MGEAIRPLRRFGDSNEFYLSVVERVEFPRPLWLGNTLDFLDPRTLGVLTNTLRARMPGGTCLGLKDVREMVLVLGVLL